ncbi:hypothetical protein RRG08_030281 [Elysia crispata]|uniref:Uncharacterized protein n=1 Tax=Elysia crispata TaxID=231223 RepID=A0AAE1CR98_9GAST|nr:hypothetical protein RRG08_030281 [Elysia crispata]
MDEQFFFYCSVGATFFERTESPGISVARWHSRGLTVPQKRRRRRRATDGATFFKRNASPGISVARWHSRGLTVPQKRRRRRRATDGPYARPSSSTTSITSGASSSMSLTPNISADL